MIWGGSDIYIRSLFLLVYILHLYLRCNSN